MRILLLILTLVTSAVSTARERIVAESPVQATTLLELYTSHGCNSCPPADRWLRTFTAHPDLWTRVIPLAFHVDYWNWLGWKDRFAEARYTDRQKAYRRSGALGSVYTPGFVVGGEEWRGWFSGAQPDLRGGEPVGRLRIEVLPPERVAVRFEPLRTGSTRGYRAHLAVLGFGLSSEIGAGENAGRTLEEDFVVLGMRSSAALPDPASPRWDMAWPELVPTPPGRRAVVVWISRDDEPAPVQAVGSWLP
jgi:hypothetical protein